MSLTRTDVENIARLARLEIAESELAQYVGTLSRIIDFVEQLNAAQTSERRADGAPVERSDPATARR